MSKSLNYSINQLFELIHNRKKYERVIESFTNLCNSIDSFMDTVVNYAFGTIFIGRTKKTK